MARKVSRPVVPNGGSISEFSNFSKLPPELRAQIWELLWEPRYVEIRKCIKAHKSDLDCSGSKAKIQSSRRHRDKTCHSRAFMLIEWDGSPDARAIGRDLTVAPPLATVENKASHQENKLAKRMGKLQQDLQRVHTINTTAVKPPKTLFVNMESRLVTLRRYILAFGLPGGESRVFFNFTLDTLVLSRHARLPHAFTIGDLSQLRRVIVPEVKIDDSGDYKAVGATTDCLFQQQGAEGALIGDFMSGATPKQQIMAVFASSRAVLDAVCPKIEHIIFSPIPSCHKIGPSTGPKNCARHFAENGSPKTWCKVDHQDESWEMGLTTMEVCDSHVNEPIMKRDFGLTQKRYPAAQARMVEGVLPVPGLPNRQRRGCGVDAWRPTRSAAGLGWAGIPQQDACV